MGEWGEWGSEGVVARGGWGVSVCAAVQGHSSGERQGDAIQWPLGRVAVSGERCVPVGPCRKSPYAKL